MNAPALLSVINRACFSILTLSFLLCGCGEKSQTTNLAPDRPNSSIKSEAQSDAQDSSWEFRLDGYDVSVQIPSREWKQRKEKKHIVDFFGFSNVGWPMLACVTSVDKQSPEEFRRLISRAKKQWESNEALLEKPTYVEQENENGDIHILAVMAEKGGKDLTYIFTTAGLVYLKQKGLTVQTFFEGHGTMQSKSFKSRERSVFESAARKFCLSPR